MKDIHRAAVACLRAALTDTALGMPLSAIDADALFALATSQQLLPILYDGALRDPAFAASPVASAMAVRVADYIAHSAEQVETVTRLTETLSAAGLDCMPLKGACLKALYPLPEWRVMGDIDLCIRRESHGRIAPLMRSMGFAAGTESDHEYQWISPAGLHVELHKSLVPTYDRDLYAFFGDGWARALPTSAPHIFALSPTDAYLYAVAHLAKHYRDGGAGAKYVLDLWLMARKGLDRAAVEDGLRALRLTDFHASIRHLAAVWLDGAAPDPLTDRLTERFFSDGVYGDPTRAVVALAARQSDTAGMARRRRLCALLFPSYETLARRYEKDGRRPSRLRLPLWWIARWGRLLIGRRGQGGKRLRELSAVSDEALAAYREDMEAVGLVPDRR